MKLVLCTPMYGGNVTGAYMKSCMELQKLCLINNINFQYYFLINESLITRARNKLCKHFLDDKESTHLLFIDADIEFDPLDIIRLIQADKHIIGVPYAAKTIDWNKVSEKAKEGIIDAERLSLSGLTGIYNKIEEDKDGETIKEVYELGTGLMLIKRETLEEMIKSNPSDYILLDGIDDIKLPLEERIYYRFFDTTIEYNRYLSEDYMFCKRWRELGGKIYILSNGITRHWGNYGFRYTI